MFLEIKHEEYYMSDISKNEAWRFAEAMAGNRPPSNVNLIENHIEWWQDNYPRHAPPICRWYNQWIEHLENDDDEFDEEYNEAYTEFVSFIEDDLGWVPD